MEETGEGSGDEKYGGEAGTYLSPCLSTSASLGGDTTTPGDDLLNVPHPGIRRHNISLKVHPQSEDRASETLESLAAASRACGAPVLSEDAAPPDAQMPSEEDQNAAGNQKTAEEAGGGSDDEGATGEANPTPPKFSVWQRAYAKDEVTGLLYESIVRRTMRGPKSRQVNVHLVRDLEEPPPGDSGDEEEELEWCWHYYVHYQGWNTSWDRWVEEVSLYDDSGGSRQLAKRLKEELNSMKKKFKRKRITDLSQLAVVRQRMSQLENERREEERIEDQRKKGALVEGDGYEEKKILSVNIKPDGDKNSKESEAACDNSTIELNGRSEEQKMKNGKSEAPARKSGRRSMNKGEIEKERRLRQRDLEGNRKQSHAQKITLPFALKKIVVDEWEIVSQCHMVPNLPSSVPVRSILDKYLKSKFDILRQKPASNEKIETYKSTDEGNQEREWVNMVEGIAIYFDEALLVRLLYQQELPQHQSIMKAKDSDLKHKRKCEIYGCEYLLRLFVRLPGLIEDSNIPEPQKRHIYSKIGDLVRFLHKHQDEFFVQAYRKPLGNECMDSENNSNKQLKVGKTDDSRSKDNPTLKGGKAGRPIKSNPDSVEQTSPGKELVEEVIDFREDSADDITVITEGLPIVSDKGTTSPVSSSRKVTLNGSERRKTSISKSSGSVASLKKKRNTSSITEKDKPANNKRKTRTSHQKEMKRNCTESSTKISPRENSEVQSIASSVKTKALTKKNTQGITAASPEKARVSHVPRMLTVTNASVSSRKRKRKGV